MKTLSCQHSDMIECWVDPSRAKCQTTVSKIFPNCGHKVIIKFIWTLSMELKSKNVYLPDSGLNMFIGECEVLRSK